MLALLLLEEDRGITRAVLQDLLWPDSDGDKQAQNLRRAVADLREVLEEGLPRGSVIESRGDRYQLHPCMVDSDLKQFRSLVNQGIVRNDSTSLQEAMGLYAGPLLATFAEDWVLPYRGEVEELYCQGVERHVDLLLASDSAKEAVRLGRMAVRVAPSREETHVSLLRAYRGANMPAEALRQYEALERMLEDEWGLQPSVRAQAALEPLPRQRVTRVEQSGSEQHGGAVPLGSPYYIRRLADAEAEGCLLRGESVVLVHGPRQVGKSSLLARTLDFGRSNGVAVAVSDFQAMGESQLRDADTFYKTLAHALAQQLGVSLDLEASWNKWLGPNLNLDSVVGTLLAKTSGRVCWGMDEVDRLFGKEYANDFFGLLRSWNNRRALDPGGPWGKLTLVLCYATEAHLFISDVNQSPFNVGVRILLRDFWQEEVRELQSRYLGINEPEVWQTVYAVTLGHPYLTRLAFAFLARGENRIDLIERAGMEDGPFADHLQRILGSILRDEAISKEVLSLLADGSVSLSITRSRMWASGLIRLNSLGKVEFRVPLYHGYLSRHLQASQ